MTAQARVARFLLGLLSRHGFVDFIDLPMSRRDMADYLGLSTEAVCRALSQFAEARIIEIPNVNQVGIIDMSALEKIVRSV
jgi:CRP/FNR family transcriptional regulator, nitrogen fixation regulation protein